MRDSEATDDPYSVPCPGCPGRIAMGSAVRGGKVICTDCGEVISLLSFLTHRDPQEDSTDQRLSP
jgi:transcription initiation factor TFIIIB Brf1 subunit/transcription initiation factor TFIIB